LGHHRVVTPRPLLAVLIGASLFAACISGREKTPNPKDVESGDFPGLTACTGPAPNAVDDFFPGADGGGQRPAAGSTVAIEGVPDAMLVCTQLGCEEECCENDCGYAAGCTYVLRTTPDHTICLDHADYVCAGTDCSPYCAPFSTHPRNSYRFEGTIEYPTTSSNPTLHVEAVCRN
jgi:hypothetical protein